VQVPVTEAADASGPEYVRRLQPATPEVPSVPSKSTVTGALYQPAWLGGRSGAPRATSGGVASYLSENVRFAVFPARSRQVVPNDAVAESGPE
jgi:hypothetical protein